VVVPPGTIAPLLVSENRVHLLLLLEVVILTPRAGKKVG
jgi:hypothetical protein